MNEALLFTTVILWITDWNAFTVYNPDNVYSKEGYSLYQQLILNIIYQKNKGRICEASKGDNLLETIECEASYPFTWILAITALNIWVKFLLRLKMTKTFGPMFKVIVKMTIDLAEFMVLWIFVMMSFTCVSCLVFNGTKYMSFFEALIFYFESSLGSWDTHKFCEDD